MGERTGGRGGGGGGPRGGAGGARGGPRRAHPVRASPGPPPPPPSRPSCHPDTRTRTRTHTHTHTRTRTHTHTHTHTLTSTGPTPAPAPRTHSHPPAQHPHPHQVGSIADHYFFEAHCEEGVAGATGCHHRRRRSDDHTSRLTSHPAVQRAEQQVKLNRHRRAVVTMPGDQLLVQQLQQESGYVCEPIRLPLCALASSSSAPSLQPQQLFYSMLHEVGVGSNAQAQPLPLPLPFQSLHKRIHI
jgi:hypothetical protein